MKIDTEQLQFIQKIETTIAQKIGLHELKHSWQVIRNEKGWRENEMYIEHAWVVIVDRASVGTGGLFSIKFRETHFREHDNPEKLVEGIFFIHKEAHSDIDIYFETAKQGTRDKIADMESFNLFRVNQGFTIDGVSFTFRIMANNIEATLRLNNPWGETWKNWTQEVQSMGERLAAQSNNPDLIKLFE